MSKLEFTEFIEDAVQLLEMLIAKSTDNVSKSYYLGAINAYKDMNERFMQA